LARYIPIIASVSEHQPTAWSAFFTDLHFLIFAFPAGVVLCFKELRDEHVFVIIYAVVASYFAGVMVRLMLTLTPVVCVSAAVAVSTVLDVYIDPTVPDIAGEEQDKKSEDGPATPSKKDKKKAAAAAPPANGISSLFTPSSSKAATKAAPAQKFGIFGLDTRLVVIGNVLFMMLFFVQHCTWVTSTAYSSPSVVLASHNPDGSQHIIDDYREAYYWLRQNTPKTAVVMSWWDYGYQIAGMADRPTLVDNNTWNNSASFAHIGTLRLLIPGVSQHISQQLARPCRRPKRSPIQYCANTMWITC
jgi:dolichyl-diphosphooligosaccharide---protein glycosyltransferase